LSLLKEVETLLSNKSLHLKDYVMSQRYVLINLKDDLINEVAHPKISELYG
jgi:hypothetical protein